MNIRLKSLFLLLISTFCMSVAAQVSGISKARIYVRSNVPGTIKVEEGGIPKKNVNKEYLVYIEAPRMSAEQEWDLVWINKKSYTARAVNIQQSKIKVGKTRDQKDIFIKPDPKNRLVQLVLFPHSGEAVMPAEAKTYTVVITGKWKGKKFRYRTSNVIELGSVFHE